MRYLHSMVRVHDLGEALDFYCNKLGLIEFNRSNSEAGRFTLAFLHAPLDTERIRIDCVSVANHNLIRLLDKPDDNRCLI